jgi:hypothetical protein
MVKVEHLESPGNTTAAVLSAEAVNSGCGAVNDLLS